MQELIEERLRGIGGELIEKHFPKGKCKERGNALVLFAELYIAIKGLVRESLGEMERPSLYRGKKEKNAFGGLHKKIRNQLRKEILERWGIEK